MSLSERLDEDMKQAMKSQDKFKLSVLRMIRSAVKYQEIGQKRALNDDEVLDILNRELKQRKESLQEFERAGREDLIDNVKGEISIISAYMPSQLSAEELQAIVQATIAEVKASGKADMGKVMGALMPKVKGKADGKEVNRLVQQLLS
ncbi:MAG TPA: GatB/YqeY domain-containing protein [Bacilli bacterium]